MLATAATATATAITITVTPLPKRPGVFRACTLGAPLVVSRQPLLDGARELLRRGASPDATLILRHAGADYDALRSTIGTAAKLTVDEDGGGSGCPKLRRWKPPQTMDQRPPMRLPRPGLSDTGAAWFESVLDEVAP